MNKSEREKASAQYLEGEISLEEYLGMTTRLYPTLLSKDRQNLCLAIKRRREQRDGRLLEVNLTMEKATALYLSGEMTLDEYMYLMDG